MGNILGIGRGKRATKLANQGFNYLQDNAVIGQAQDTGLSAMGSLAGALGLGTGDQAQQAASSFNNFLDSTGYQTQLQAGQDAITSSAAARGALNSGSTLKALQDRGQGLAQQGYKDYLSLLTGVAGQGQQAATAVGAAGTDGGAAAAESQPQNTGIFGRLFRV